MTERPLTKTLYFTSMRCASSRCVRETRMRKHSQQRTREQCQYAHLRTYTPPTRLFAAGESFQPTPSPLYEPARCALLGFVLNIFEGQFLTWLELHAQSSQVESRGPRGLIGPEILGHAQQPKVGWGVRSERSCLRWSALYPPTLDIFLLSLGPRFLLRLILKPVEFLVSLDLGLVPRRAGPACFFTGENFRRS